MKEKGHEGKHLLASDRMPFITAFHRYPHQPIVNIGVGFSVPLLLFGLVFCFAQGLFEAFPFVLIGFVLYVLGVSALGFTVELISLKRLNARNRAKQLQDIDLKTLSLDELHALIDYQREQGNLDEADRISKHLLQAVEELR